MRVASAAGLQLQSVVDVGVDLGVDLDGDGDVDMDGLL